MILKKLVSLLPDSRKILVVMSLIIAALIADTALTRISIFFIGQTYDPSGSVPLFIVIAIIFATGQYVILAFVKEKTRVLMTKSTLHFNALHKIVQMLQYVLTGIIVCVIIQIVLFSYYSTALLIVDILISYTLATIMMVVLAKSFFLWFRSKRNSVVFSYGLSSAVVAINAAITLLFVSLLLLARPREVRELLLNVPAFIAPNSSVGMLDYAYFISSIISFLLMWGSTALLLRHYSTTSGRARYWTIVSIPLAYFLIQFVTIFVNSFAPFINANPIFFSVVLTLIFTLSKPAGGILFGVAFWAVTRGIQTNVVRDYMIISAFGLILLFTSNQAGVLGRTSYPPFGLATVSFVGLASYLVLVGIYSSAISVAQDSDLRASIRKFALQESKLLDSIGTAEMEQEVLKRVVILTKQNQDRLAEETGIQSSLTEDDMKAYLEQVIKEVKRGDQE